MKTRKGEFSVKLEIIDLDEPAYDGSINLQPLPKKVPDKPKRPKKQDSIALF